LHQNNWHSVPHVTLVHTSSHHCNTGTYLITSDAGPYLVTGDTGTHLFTGDTDT